MKHPDTDQPIDPAAIEKCVRCGMVANLDPSLHTERYGHRPVVLRDGKMLRFNFHTYTFDIRVI